MLFAGQATSIRALKQIASKMNSGARLLLVDWCRPENMQGIEYAKNQFYAVLFAKLAADADLFEVFVLSGAEILG